MTLVGILTGLLVLSLMMLVHELGHYLAGRALGFKIEEFSIFMGPVLFEWERDGIRYNIKLLPIGASVSFAGELTDGADEPPTSETPRYAPDDPGLFYNRPRWRRAIVIAMGPLVNFLTAFLAFVVMFTTFGHTVPVLGNKGSNTLYAESQELMPGDRIVSMNGRTIRTVIDVTMTEYFLRSDEPFELGVKRADGSHGTVTLQPKEWDVYLLGVEYIDQGENGIQVHRVYPESNNGQPVLEVGDLLLGVDGIPIRDQGTLSQHLRESAHAQVHVELIRNGEEMRVALTPMHLQTHLPLGLTFTAGSGFLSAMDQAISYPWSLVKATVRSLGKMFAGDIAVKDSLAGPVGIVSMFTEVVKADVTLADKIANLLWLFASISVAVGFTNLVPIPPFDGYHLTVLAIEGVARRDLPVRVKQIVAMAGMIFILALAAFIIYLDISRLLR